MFQRILQLEEKARGLKRATAGRSPSRNVDQSHKACSKREKRTHTGASKRALALFLSGIVRKEELWERKSEFAAERRAARLQKGVYTRVGRRLSIIRRMNLRAKGGEESFT